MLRLLLQMAKVVWTNAGAGDVTTAQLNAASNSLDDFTSWNCYLTNWSNQDPQRMMIIRFA